MARKAAQKADDPTLQIEKAIQAKEAATQEATMVPTPHLSSAWLQPHSTLEATPRQILSQSPTVATSSR